ncbi:hypothetical protein vseg_016876 [Gypsophila vaccaria]
MSEVRLVRCPKCDKVLPEPSGFPVYKCGGCGAVLRARKRLSVSGGSIDGSVEKTSVNVGGGGGGGGGSLDKENFVKESAISMENETEFHGGLPKSPMRDRFLDDLVKTPRVRSREVSRSPVRARGGSDAFDGDGIDLGARSSNVSRSPMRMRGGSDASDGDGFDLGARSRNVSRSPMRMRGRTPVSVRTRDVSRSPLRGDGRLSDLADAGRSTTNSMNGDVPKSPMRQGVAPGFEENTEQERMAKMTTKTSFGVWLPDDTHEGRSGDNSPGGRRSTWRDRARDRPDHISEGIRSVSSDEHDRTSERSFEDPIHGGGRNKGGMYRDGRFRSAVRGHARPNVVDGPSNYHQDPNHGYGDPMHSFENARGPAGIQESYLQRAEFLRKYKASGNQPSGLDDAGMSLPRFYSEPEGRSEDESSRIRRGPMKQLTPDRNVQRPSHFRPGPDLAANRENMYNVNPPVYEDRFSGQMKWGPRSNQHLPKHEVPEYAPRRSSDYDDQDTHDSYVNDRHAHHPACGCSRCCYSNDRRSRDQHSYYDHRRQVHLGANLTSSHGMDHERYAPQAYNPIKMAHSGPRGQSSHSADQRRRLEVANLNKRLCRPISGGAPFVLCSNCFQLLILPGNVIAKYKKQQLQCGACSTVILFDLQKTSSDATSTQNKLDSVHEPGTPSQVTNALGTKHQRDSSVAGSTDVGSYDFDAGGSSFHSKGSEASSRTQGHLRNSSLPDNTIRSASSPSRFSLDGRISDTQSVRSSQPNSSEVPMMIRPPPGSPLHHRLEHPSQAAEKQIIDKETTPEGPLHMTDATETEVPYNELPMTGLSQDSEDYSRESSTIGDHKVVQSHMDAILKGFEVLSGQGTPVRAKVYVNGQPIPKSSVREAEKLAGPIEPGDYWYDPKAGFWGVMGHRCLGIIPPFIEEFRFPMPENCSRGDSNVFVNGRELQERDLNLLARRGLPTTRNKYYVVDISGKVVDEQTRDFVANLGKLAPSVERNKCGFGMQVPEQLED